MKTLISILASLFITLSLNAQSFQQATKAIKKVNNIEQLKSLKEKYPDWDISNDKTLLSDSLKFPDIVVARKGDVVTKQYYANAPRYVLKVLNIEEEELCKVKYIYLDGSKYSKSEIDSIRTIIIQRYEAGEKFETLVKEYTMDGNPTGDLNWFYQGMMVDEFDRTVRGKTKGEIFNVNVEKKNWFYVVLKNHDNKYEKVFKGIKIKYNI